MMELGTVHGSMVGIGMRGQGKLHGDVNAMVAAEMLLEYKDGHEKVEEEMVLVMVADEPGVLERSLGHSREEGGQVTEIWGGNEAQETFLLHKREVPGIPLYYKREVLGILLYYRRVVLERPLGYTSAVLEMLL